MILLVVALNWFVIFVLLGLFTPYPIQAASGSLLVIFILYRTAQTKLAESIFRWVSGFRPASSSEQQITEPFTKELCKWAGIKQIPDLYVADHPFPNAFCIGNRTIGVTKGLLHTATPAELRGVLAHEIGHLRGGDSVRCAAGVVINVGGVVACWIIFHVDRFHSFNLLTDPYGFIHLDLGLYVAFIRVSIGVLRWYLGLSWRLVGPREEYKADTFAIQAGCGAGFLSFLQKTASFAHSSERGFLERTAASHPPLIERINRIKKRLDKE